ncbi:MAG TPA: D-glycero-beta-D-manno-heptose 1,7-bisphosphate 7-phosphatase [Gammaproteobacteria bacterium]|nr:D-glycero-beta-D-manno-heptose 1,7-bisphosphate 7-phosphatase [Ktedonobacteraceae bacterium]HVC28974.1 D-glycero-beta-D-manno-heptose 1,7-bisphosphate 7-phosphatase [Gammaproteobacteria bacterium]
MNLVILDRDGVINFDSDAYIKTPDEWRPIPGSLDAIARLHQTGFTLVVASNQSGVGRGLIKLPDLEAINSKMLAAIEAAGGKLAGFFYCPHVPDDHCDCRKPKPGLLRQIEKRFGVTVKGMPAIGDSLRDLEAAQIVGARAILVRTGNGEQTLKQLTTPENIEIYTDLAAAATQIIRERKA